MNKVRSGLETPQAGIFRALFYNWISVSPSLYNGLYHKKRSYVVKEQLPLLRNF